MSYLKFLALKLGPDNIYAAFRFTLRPSVRLSVRHKQGISQNCL